MELTGKVARSDGLISEALRPRRDTALDGVVADCLLRRAMCPAPVGTELKSRVAEPTPTVAFSAS